MPSTPEGWLFKDCEYGECPSCPAVDAGGFCGCACHGPEPLDLTDQELEAMRATLEKPHA